MACMYKVGDVVQVRDGMLVPAKFIYCTSLL
jgi:hypothetical protein